MSDFITLSIASIDLRSSNTGFISTGVIFYTCDFPTKDKHSILLLATCGSSHTICLQSRLGLGKCPQSNWRVFRLKSCTSQSFFPIYIFVHAYRVAKHVFDNLQLFQSLHIYSIVYTAVKMGQTLLIPSCYMFIVNLHVLTINQTFYYCIYCINRFAKFKF